MELQQKQDQLEAIADSIKNREIDIEIAKTCTNPVPGEGNPDAEILFIGEAPGAQEDKQGRPFIGASGKFLDEMLASIGLERKDVFVTNIVKFRPPKNRDPKPNEIKACLPVLLQQIGIIQPRLVVFLGRHAMNVFMPQLKISEAHGQEITKTVEIDGNSITATFLPLYHPAAALYNGGMRKTLLEDFARIPKILELIK